MVQNYPATIKLIALLRQAPQTQQVRSLLRSVDMVQGCLQDNDNVATLRSLLQIARDRYAEAAGKRGSGIGPAEIEAFDKFEREIESIPEFEPSGTSRAPASPSEDEEEEESTRLQKAGTAAVSVLSLPFLAVGQVLGAASGILGGVSGAVQDIGKALGPSQAKPSRRTRPTQP